MRATKTSLILLLYLLLFATTTISANDNDNEIAVVGTIALEFNVDSLMQTPIDTVIYTDIIPHVDTIIDSWLLQSVAELDTTHIPKVVFEECNDSVYIARLSSLPTAIELAYNSVVKKYIESYTTKRLNYIEIMMGLSYYYFPIFEQILEEEEMPAELKYLSIVESALRPQARSHMGAAGLWQLMPRTAKHLNVEINSLVDDRYSPQVATRAAMRYLKEMFAIYKDWGLAIAAYNCGPGNVNKAIVRSGGARDYWEIYNYLPRETRGYLPAFIAVTYAMNYADHYDITPNRAKLPLVIDTVNVTSRLHFNQISSVLNTPIDMLRELNPQYKLDIIPATTEKLYPLCLPEDIMYTYIQLEDSIASYGGEEYAQRVVAEPAEPKTIYHKIKSGESLSTIARRYGTSVATLKKLNGLTNSNIRAGKSLMVQGTNLSQGQKLSGTVNHKVQRGDSLGKLSKRYGVSIDKIQAVNNLSDTNIKIGDMLKIPLA